MASLLNHLIFLAVSNITRSISIQPVISNNSHCSRVVRSRIGMDRRHHNASKLFSLNLHPIIRILGNLTTEAFLKSVNIRLARKLALSKSEKPEPTKRVLWDLGIRIQVDAKANKLCSNLRSHDRKTHWSNRTTQRNWCSADIKEVNQRASNSYFHSNKTLENQGKEISNSSFWCTRTINLKVNKTNGQVSRVQQGTHPKKAILNSNSTLCKSDKITSSILNNLKSTGLSMFPNRIERAHVWISPQMWVGPKRIPLHSIRERPPTKTSELRIKLLAIIDMHPMRNQMLFNNHSLTLRIIIMRLNKYPNISRDSQLWSRQERQINQDQRLRLAREEHPRQKIRSIKRELLTMRNRCMGRPSNSIK